MLKKTVLTIGIFSSSAAPAFAHLDPAQHGSIMAGLSHPLFGTDHILAMLAVGLWATLLARGKDDRALWLVPAAFIGAMALGFIASLSGLPLPFVEPMILASLVVIGLLAAFALDVPAGAAMTMVAFFAFFHGHAHGGELGSAGALSFGVGFAAATALLHGAGIGMGLGLDRIFGNADGRLVARIAGAATALAGAWLAAGS